MPLDPKITVAGLYTNGNQNSAIPPGALSTAQNVVLRANGQLEPRRGLPAETNGISASSVFNSLGFYGGGRVAQYTDGSAASKLAFCTGAGGAWTPYSGTYSPVNSATNRMRFVEASQNLYFNTNTTLQVLTSLSATPAPAGVPECYPVLPYSTFSGLAGNPDAAGAWFTKNTAVGYRAVLTYKDTNNNLKIGAPSGRCVIVNPADATTTLMARTTGTTVTVTTSAAHGFASGDSVKLDAVDGTFGAAGLTFTISTVPSATTFTYGEAGANVSTATVHTFTSGSKSAQLYVPLPWAITGGSLGTSFSIRLYRTVMSASASGDPGDEMFQIYERRITSADIVQTYCILSDVTPETSLYSSPLYTNPKTGDGITSAGEQAPVGRDFCLWQERLWFGNTFEKQRLNTQLLGTGSPSGLQANDLVVVAGTVFEMFDYLASGVSANYNQSIVYTSFLASKNIQLTVATLVGDINLQNLAVANNNNVVRAKATSGYSDAPGKFELASIDPTTSNFYFASSRTTAFSPTPPVATKVVNTSSRTSSTVTVNTATAHGFAIGTQFQLASGTTTRLAAFPIGVKTVAAVNSATQFTYTEAGTATSFNSGYVVHALDNKSDNNTRPNGIMFSKYQEPEAVPVANYFTVGAKNKNILRIVPHRDKLYVFKEDGLYTVSGTPPYQTVDLLDASCILLAPDTATVLGGKIYALTNQGVAAISESGVQVVSYAVERDLRTIIASMGATNIYSCYGAAYESDRLYILGVTSSGSTNSVVQYVYSYLTKGWTTWNVTSRAAGVDPATDKITFCGTAQKLLVERKAYNYSDYVDTITSSTISAVNTVAKTITTGVSLTTGEVVVDANGIQMIITSDGTTASYVSRTSFTPTTGACTIYDGYSITVVFSRHTQGQPGVMKHFKDAQLHFGNCGIYNMTLQYANDYTNTTSAITTPDALLWTPNGVYRNFRALVPEEMRRGTSLYFGFAVTHACAYFQLDGYSLDVQPYSAKVNK